MKLKITIFGDKENQLTCALRAIEGLVEMGYLSGEVDDRESSFHFAISGNPSRELGGSGGSEGGDEEGSESEEESERVIAATRFAKNEENN